MLNPLTKKTSLGYFFLFFLLTPVYSQVIGLKSLLVCGDSKILLVDYEKSRDSIPEIVWSWDAHLAEDLPEEFRNKKFNSIDDCKSINDGQQIMVSSSSGAVALLKRKGSKVLFYANVPNAHSVEILPNNLLVAAASTSDDGNRIMLFDMDHPDQVVYSDSLYSAHGLVWDSGRKSLYALGYDVLREYKLASRDSLYLLNEWKIPGEGGHDLYPSPDGNRLFMTEHTGTWIFDLEHHRFNKIEEFPDAGNIKSIGQNKSGQYIFTVPEESWWTHHVSFSQPLRKLAFPGMRVYKARWFDE